MGKPDKVVKVIIGSPVLVHTYESKDVIFYKVTSIFESKEHGTYQIVNHKRFSEFYELYENLLTEIKGGSSELPPPPRKHILSFINRSSKAFLKERAEELQQFMSALNKISSVKKMKEYCKFLGLISNKLRETSFVFESIEYLNFREIIF